MRKKKQVTRRKPKKVLTKKIVDTILKFLSLSTSMEETARIVGISKQKIYVWMSSGKADHEAGITSLESALYTGVPIARQKASDLRVEKLEEKYKERKYNPTLLTEKVLKECVASVRAGLTFKNSAARSRIGEATFSVWMARGSSNNMDGIDSIYRDLFLSIHAAKANRSLTSWNVINKAIKAGNISVAQWSLINYDISNTKKVEIVADIKQESKFDLSGLSEDQLRALVKDESD